MLDLENKPLFFIRRLLSDGTWEYFASKNIPKMYTLSGAKSIVTTRKSPNWEIVPIVNIIFGESIKKK